MSIVKIKKSNDVIINIHNDFIPKNQEDYKKNIKKIYDTINEIFKSSDNNNLFYNPNELKELNDMGILI